MYHQECGGGGQGPHLCLGIKGLFKLVVGHWLLVNVMTTKWLSRQGDPLKGHYHAANQQNKF